VLKNNKAIAQTFNFERTLFNFLTQSSKQVSGHFINLPLYQLPFGQVQSYQDLT